MAVAGCPGKLRICFQLLEDLQQAGTAKADTGQTSKSGGQACFGVPRKMNQGINARDALTSSSVGLSCLSPLRSRHIPK